MWFWNISLEMHSGHHMCQKSRESLETGAIYHFTKWKKFLQRGRGLSKRNASANRGSLASFLSSHPPHLCSIKEPGIQSTIRWLFWDISLPSSWSDGFLITVIFLASIPRLWYIGLLCGKKSELGWGSRRGKEKMWARVFIVFFVERSGWVV